MMILIFFFQAEDGIRDGHVTGVQTCALPIFSFRYTKAREPSIVVPWPLPPYRYLTGKWLFKKRRRFGICSRINRSEERRVGKEGRYRWHPEQRDSEKSNEGGRLHKSSDQER